MITRFTIQAENELQKINVWQRDEVRKAARRISSKRTPDSDGVFIVDSIDVQKAFKNVQRNEARRARNEAMKSLALVRVRGALGGVYWE